jgi:adenosylcobyric acid synthase
LHGLFEADAFRAAVLTAAGRGDPAWASAGTSYAAAREAQLDRLGDLVEEHLDLAAIERLIET